MNHWNNWSLWLSMIVHLIRSQTLPSKKCWRPAIFGGISGVPLCDLLNLGLRFAKNIHLGNQYSFHDISLTTLRNKIWGLGSFWRGSFFQTDIHVVGPINFEAYTQMFATRQLMSCSFVTCNERILCRNFTWTCFFVPLRRISQS